MRQLSALTLFSLGLAANAQVFITHGQVPTGTFIDRLYAVTHQGSAGIPTDGADQVWDLSTVTLVDIGTFTHGPASATPFAADHPSANIAWHMDAGSEGSFYTYFHVTTTGMAMVASDVPDAPHVYTDHWQVMAFPLGLNSSFTDTREDADGSETVTWTYSGHGTVTTTTGTFTNVVKMVSDDNDLVLWRTSPLVPLLIRMNGILMIVGAGTTGMADLQTAAMTVYPVPCTDHLNVEATTPAPWRIVDVQGRTVAGSSFARTGSTVLDTRALLPGTYVLHLADANGPRVARFVKQ